jgi:hypothetical protein
MPRNKQASWSSSSLSRSAGKATNGVIGLRTGIVRVLRVGSSAALSLFLSGLARLNVR